MNEPAPFSLPNDGWFHIAAFGEWPHKPTGLTQIIDDIAADEIIKAFTEFRAAPNWPGVLIDFDHQSLDVDKPTVAAGWIVDLAKRDNGLWAQVRWSDIGRKSIEGGRYRFISPVWKSSDCAKLDGDRIRPLKLMNCAVTNDPNIKGLFPLSNTSGAAIEFSPPPMPIHPEPTTAPSSPSALPKPPRIGMDAALFNRALHSRSPRAITNRRPLTRQQEIAIILKSRNGPSGQVSIGPAKTDSGAKSGQPIYSGNSNNKFPENIILRNNLYSEKARRWYWAQQNKKVPGLTPEQQYHVDEAKKRLHKSNPTGTNFSPKIANALLDAYRISMKDRGSHGHASNGHKSNGHGSNGHASNGTPNKSSGKVDTAPIVPESENARAQELADQDQARADQAFYDQGWRKGPDGKWLSQYESAKIVEQEKAAAAQKQTQIAAVNPGTTGYVPGSLAGTRYSGVSTWTPSFNNRARRSGILANYASGRNYDDEQRKAIFAWYAGSGSKSSGRDSAGRIANLQSQIDALESSRPNKPDDPADFSLIDVAEVKRQAMAEGVDSGEVLSRIAAAKSTNAERMSAWAALKRKFRKEYKSKPARERAIGRYLDKLQSAYKADMENYVKANAKIDGKITELRAKIAEEQIREGEDVRKKGIKDAEKTQAELKSIERDKQRESVRAQIAADKKAAKDKADAERAARNQPQTPEQKQAQYLKAVRSAENLYDGSVKLAQNMVTSGRIDNAKARYPDMNWAKLEAYFAAIKGNNPNPSGFEIKKQRAAMAEVVELEFRATYKPIAVPQPK